jgi:CBS domain-containing protein
MQKTAKDIMQSQVVTVSPDAPLHSTQRLFYEEGIHGAPVVDDQGRVVGMITSTDILRAATETEETTPTGPDYFGDDLDYPSGLLPLATEDFQERLQDITVADFMTEGVVHVAPSTPISELARTIRENKIHRLLVVENGTLRGIVSTFDLVTLLEKSG